MRDDGAVNNGSTQASRLASEAGIDSGAFRNIGETTLRQRSSSRYHQRQAATRGSVRRQPSWMAGQTHPTRQARTAVIRRIIAHVTRGWPTTANPWCAYADDSATGRPPPLATANSPRSRARGTRDQPAR